MTDEDRRTVSFEQWEEAMLIVTALRLVGAHRVPDGIYQHLMREAFERTDDFVVGAIATEWLWQSRDPNRINRRVAKQLWSHWHRYKTPQAIYCDLSPACAEMLNTLVCPHELR